MLIKFDKLLKFCKTPIKGIIHIGAHECEEKQYYDPIGITDEKVIWIEAMQEKVELCKKRGLYVYNIVVSDYDNENVTFNVTNNGQSSSMLQLGTHMHHHPTVKVINQYQTTTTTMKTFIEQNKIDIDKFNFMNLDIQGAELKALKGMKEYINKIDYIYLEVNSEYVYEKCALLPEIDNFLGTLGFKCVCLEMTPNCWGDAFYVRK